MGRRISGGEIQRSSGVEAAWGLTCEGGGFGGRRYSPHCFSEVGGIRMQASDANNWPRHGGCDRE